MTRIHPLRGMLLLGMLVVLLIVPVLAAQPAQPAATAQAKPAPVKKAPPMTMIRDKTLVAWVAPANLTQKGGSALTIEDGEDHFDAIVFGELHPARWMAGSDGFGRTHRDQKDWPAETADEKTVVQIAMVYKGNQITVYRDGKLYSEHRIDQPQTFGGGSFAVLGLRHLAAGNDQWFAGAVLDARIYNLPLSAEQIAALKCNQPSDPRPLAWWNFATGKADDVIGTFPNSKLYGAAKVVDSRLILDGKGSYLVSARGQVPSQGGPAAPPAGSGDLVADARAVRDQLLADPHRPGYHFVTPEGICMPFDSNGAIFWKGRYHLFYIFQDRRGHNWGHVSSIDLFHWRHHPTGLVAGMFSGNCFINKDGRPTMCYHQVGQGNAMAVALDDDLNEWKKLDSNPITPKTKPGDPHHGEYSSWDPYGWLEGDTYYAIFGGQRPGLVKADKLEGEWKYVGDLLANTAPGVSINEDVSCADFFKIGDKHMLLCISHGLGCRYYLGQWKNEQFHPAFHEKMSWVDHSFFAPESLLDDKGRRIMWSWLMDMPGFKTKTDHGWSGTMSLPRVLSLGEDGVLRMNPPREIERLRYNEKNKADLTVPADGELPVEGVAGNSIELNLTIRAKDARQFGVKVCCSPDSQEQTLVYYDASDKKLKIDTSKSSLAGGTKTVEAGPLELKADEPLQLRVFVDKSVVEVFANGGRQVVMRRIYPSRPDSVGVVLFSNSGPSGVVTLQAWDMMPSNPF